jgi:hypothetical protein
MFWAILQAVTDKSVINIIEDYNKKIDQPLDFYIFNMIQSKSFLEIEIVAEAINFSPLRNKTKKCTIT